MFIPSLRKSKTYFSDFGQQIVDVLFNNRFTTLLVEIRHNNITLTASVYSKPNWKLDSLYTEFLNHRKNLKLFSDLMNESLICGKIFHSFILPGMATCVQHSVYEYKNSKY